MTNKYHESTIILCHSEGDTNDMSEILTLENLSMSYGENLVLNNINLTVDSGQVIGYIGPNGAGKSTTVKIMLGLVSGYTGTIKLFGETITENSVEYKRKIGYVPEQAEIYDTLTAREYLTFTGELYGLTEKEVNHKAAKLMELFGIKRVYDARISSFSKGMKQRLLIISSLLHNPDLLFLDEPLAGLDANSVMIVKELLAILASKGKTIFYSSHIMDVVEKISSRIILLNKGEIIADGSFDSLKEQIQEASLEQIFNQLTGFDQHEEIAHEIVSVIEG